MLLLLFFPNLFFYTISTNFPILFSVSLPIHLFADLLAAWEDLLGWSENAAAARKMQEDMIVLKHALNRLGNKSSYEQLDTEPSIQIAIEALKVRST